MGSPLWSCKENASLESGIIQWCDSIIYGFLSYRERLETAGIVIIIHGGKKWMCILKSKLFFGMLAIQKNCAIIFFMIFRNYEAKIHVLY